LTWLCGVQLDMELLGSSWSFSGCLLHFRWFHLLPWRMISAHSRSRMEHPCCEMQPMCAFSLLSSVWSVMFLCACSSVQRCSQMFCYHIGVTRDAGVLHRISWGVDFFKT
jgi:hypothetical protein